MNLKKVELFFEFLVFGLVFGIIEDLIVVESVTYQHITRHMFWSIFFITLLFAIIGELLVDDIDFLKLLKLSKKHRLLEIFSEFLIFGIIMGVFEDLIALYLSTGMGISIRSIKIAVLVAVPFAFVSEVLVDSYDFTTLFKRIMLKLNI